MMSLMIMLILAAVVILRILSSLFVVSCFRFHIVLFHRCFWYCYCCVCLLSILRLHVF